MLKRLIMRLAGRKSSRRRHNPIAELVDVLEERKLLTLAFNFDYSLDTNGFFDSAERRETLELAGQLIGSHLNDTFAAIEPSGNNTWTASFTNPGTGEQTSLTDLTIAQNEILIFAGGRDLGSGTLGQGGFGGFSWNGSQNFGETVATRGQGTDDTDFGRWGGTLTLNSETNWHFGETVDGLEQNEFDFLTVAMHELVHAIGFASGNPAYDRFVNGQSFNGPNAVAEFDEGGSVPLSDDLSHFAIGTTEAGQPVLLDPQIGSGIRELPTFLDWAVIDDFGYDVNQAVNDFGDAPSDLYPTLAAQNGARHNTNSQLFLGVYGDTEDSGQSSDDDDGFDDDDGIVFLDSLFAGSTVRVDVTANREGVLNAFIDFNQDGDWTDPGEQIFTNVDLSGGTQQLAFEVPEDATNGASFARFRLNSDGNLSSTGAAADGEVEDYEVTLRQEDGPFAVDDTAAVSPNGSVNIDVVANDLPAGRVEVRGFSDPTQGTVTQNADGTLRFSAANGSSGTASFTYTVGVTQTELVGSNERGEFGRATAIFGDTLVVGAPLATTAAGASTGFVQIYQRDGLDWVLEQTITAPDEEAGDRFGFSVDIDGDTIVIGSRGDDDDGTNAGSAYVYQRDDVGSDFVFRQKLLASQGRLRDQFGFDVAIEDNAIVVGIRLDDNGGSNAGSAEYFRRDNASSDFEFVSRIVSNNIEGGDQFGNAVILDEGRLFVGARRDDNLRVDAGAVYVFALDGDQWVQTQEIFSERPENQGFFGFSIAVSGSTIAIGQPTRERISRTGRVFVHEQNLGGADNYGFVQRIDPQGVNGANRFGFSVAIEGDRVVVGGPRTTSQAPNAGEVRIYERNEGGNNNFGRTQILAGANESGGDEFGYSVLISGDQVFTGARRTDEGGTNSGSLFIDDLRTDIGEVFVTIA